MDKKLKRKKGLTLLEVVIVLGLMSIVTSLVFAFVNTTQKKSKEIEIRQKLQHDGTMITESLMTNVLESQGIYALEFTTNQVSNKITGLIFKFDESNLAGITQYRDAIIYYIDDTNFKTKEHYYGKGIVGNDKEISKCLSSYAGGRIPECGHWKNEKIISENINELNIENEKLKLILNPILNTGGIINATDIDLISKTIRREKSINLEVILESPYYNKEIVYKHTVELSFRNAK